MAMVELEHADSLNDILNRIYVLLDSVVRLESALSELVYGAAPPTGASSSDYVSNDRFNKASVMINDIDRRINYVVERLAERI